MIDIDELLKKVESTLYYIANDQIELSHDKVRNQRDDYQLRARKMLDTLIEAQEEILREKESKAFGKTSTQTEKE